MKSFINASFRDPNGRVFSFNNSIYREIYISYAEEYEKLMSSGLYNRLVSSGQLISHDEEVVFDKDASNKVYKTIQPEYLPFISYPYEWSFSQLKDAALLVLSIQRTALEFDMTLKDASAYNIQFQGCQPIFIDTLSFESYQEGEPWLAYRQFCQHFLAPLLLGAYKDIRLIRLLQLFLDGIPLDLTRRLLPWRKLLQPGVFLHIFMHSRYEQKFSAHTAVNRDSSKGMNKQGFLGLIDSLESLIKSLSWTPIGTEWSDYYSEGKNNYSNASLMHKTKIVKQLIGKANPSCIWDLGANLGFFSRIASNSGIRTISMDFDPAAVEMNYLTGKKGKDSFLYPLLIDLTNPSPAIGWNLQERMSLFKRGPADLIMALALLHHLVIGNNVPFSLMAEFFAGLGNFLIIEFIPKEDTQVQLMLANREDIFAEYDIENFRFAFKRFYEIIAEIPLEGSLRTLFLMQLKLIPS